MVTSASITAPLLAESVVTVSQLCSRLPGNGRTGRLNPSTVTRWILSGVIGLAGVRVRLEAARVGGKWATSLEAYQRFVLRLTPPEVAAVADLRSPSQRGRAAGDADRQLDAAGF